MILKEIVMKNKETLTEQRKKIVKGLELAYEKMIAFKRSLNSPLVISSNGEVSEIDIDKAKTTTVYKWH